MAKKNTARQTTVLPLREMHAKTMGSTSTHPQGWPKQTKGTISSWRGCREGGHSHTTSMNAKTARVLDACQIKRSKNCLGDTQWS